MIFDDGVTLVENKQISVFQLEKVMLQNVQENLRGHDEDVVFVQLFVPSFAGPVINAICPDVSAHVQVGVTTNGIRLFMVRRGGRGEREQGREATELRQKVQKEARGWKEIISDMGRAG